jgi:adenylate cyclase class 2
MTVSSRDAASVILAELGFFPQFLYEKYRTEYQRDGSRGIVLLDETPIGTFFEIEGAPRSIDALAKALGFCRSDYITASYGRLYRDYCELQNVASRDMVFNRRKNSRGVSYYTEKKLP